MGNTDDLALDLEDLKQLQSITTRPRVLSLLSTEIRNLEKKTIEDAGDQSGRIPSGSAAPQVSAGKPNLNSSTLSSFSWDHDLDNDQLDQLEDESQSEELSSLVLRACAHVESMNAKLKSWEAQHGKPYEYTTEEKKLRAELRAKVESMFGYFGEIPPSFPMPELVFGTTVSVVIVERSFTSIVVDGRSSQYLPSYLITQVKNDDEHKLVRVWDNYLATMSGNALRARRIVEFLNSEKDSTMDITEAITRVKQKDIEFNEANACFSKATVLVFGPEGFWRCIGNECRQAKLGPDVLLLFSGSGAKNSKRYMKTVDVEELKSLHNARKHSRISVGVAAHRDPATGGRMMSGSIVEGNAQIDAVRPHVSSVFAKCYDVFESRLNFSLLVYTRNTSVEDKKAESHIHSYLNLYFPEADCDIIHLQKRENWIVRLVHFKNKSEYEGAKKSISNKNITVQLYDNRKVRYYCRICSKENFEKLFCFVKKTKNKKRKRTKEDHTEKKKRKRG